MALKAKPVPGKMTELFNADALKRLREENFSGTLKVVWKKGAIKTFDFSVKYRTDESENLIMLDEDEDW